MYCHFPDEFFFAINQLSATSLPRATHVEGKPCKTGRKPQPLHTIWRNPGRQATMAPGWPFTQLVPERRSAEASNRHSSHHASRKQRFLLEGRLLKNLTSRQHRGSPPQRRTAAAPSNLAAAIPPEHARVPAPPDPAGERTRRYLQANFRG